MKENIKISIISIAYNNEKDIEQTILSVINQTYNNIEYIIVDGKSTDNTLEIVKKYQYKIDKIISEPDKGIYDAINKGIRAATGDIVGLIHAGDKLHDDEVIEDVNAHFQKNDIDASYGHSIIVNDNDKAVRVNKSPHYSKKLFKRGWMPSHQSIYIKKSIFDQLGYYRLDLGGSGDYEFVLRYFYFNDLKIKRMDRFIIKFSMGGISTSNYHKILKTQKTHIKCWELNGEKPPFYMVPMKLARKIPQFLKAFLKRGKSK